MRITSLELIGNLAAYRPYAKIVLIEGHKETRFDVDMIARLFPDLAEKGNFIPVGNRRMTTGVRVRLLEVLSETGLTGRAVSISDGDLRLGNSSGEKDTTHFIWPVYEIENFLLDPNVLRGAAKVLLGKDPFANDAKVIEALRRLAVSLLLELALDEVQYGLNEQFVRSLAIGGSKVTPEVDLRNSAEASKARLNAIDVSSERISGLLQDASERFRNQLSTLEFLRRFPGDRLMRALAGELGVSGDHFRNACLDQAQRLGSRPADMERTLLEALK